MDLTELYAGCRTYRRFLQTPVPRDAVERMLENARTANSASNAQPVRYTAVLDPELVARMQPLVKWAAYLPPEQGMPKAGEHPTAFVAVSLIESAGSFALVDMGIAVHALTTTAWEAGIGSCIMGAIRAGEISELLGIPDSERLKLVVALGYPSHTSTIVEVPEDGSLAYFLDENRNYCVPKLALRSVARIR